MKDNEKIADWEQVDLAIREMGELEIQQETVNGKLTEQVNELKAAAKTQVAPLEARRKYLSALIEEFCHKTKQPSLRSAAKN